MFLASWSCGHSGPSAPSLPNVAGQYHLTVTPCSLPGKDAAQVEDFPPLLPVFGVSSDPNWTLSQVGGNATGTASGQNPPLSWSGSLTAAVENAAKIEITTFTYRDSSSHGGIHRLSGIGEGFVDGSGIFGTLAGDYTSTPTFGGFVGETASCHGSQMPFRFSRLQ